MAFRHRESQFADAVRPDLILLDLNLPRKDGRQVLTEIKADALLKSIPVVVLTTSTAEKDVLQSYQLQANCYISKPVDLEQFITAVRAVQEGAQDYLVKGHVDGASVLRSMRYAIERHRLEVLRRDLERQRDEF